MVEYHLRRGIRPECQCEYCKLKIDAFNNMATAGKHFFRAVAEGKFRPPAYLNMKDPDDVHYAVWMYRKILRKNWHQQRLILRHIILGDKIGTDTQDRPDTS